MSDNSSIQLATESLLSIDQLNPNQLGSILGQAMSPHVDLADIYLQNSIYEAWYLEDQIVKKSDFGIDRGFGFRVVSGDKTGFAYADDINLKALKEAALSAKSIAKSGENKLIQIQSPIATSQLYAPINPLQSILDQQKVSLLQEIDQKARALDSRVRQVIVSLSARHDIILLLNSRGSIAADIRPLVNLWIKVIVEQGGKREQGSSGGGARAGYELFLNGDTVSDYIKKAIHQASLNLEAKPAPAGQMPVVLGPGWPAILLHEAVGHGLEADFNRKGSSIFSNRLGQKVASTVCTIVDDGTIPGRRGSLSIDDEGTPSKNTVLIEDGILKNYMQDLHNARLMGMEPTGNGRRESYSHLPLPRMTNTYMLPGRSDPAEILQSIKKGIYAVDFSGGQVDITSGQFVFSMSEAYMIENGKITYPVKGATLIGNGPEVLQQVSMVGNDLALDKGIGTCGKAGQSIPVGVGQPTLKVDNITVGGTETNSRFD